jgi:hypothetical protein
VSHLPTASIHSSCASAGAGAVRCSETDIAISFHPVPIGHVKRVAAAVPLSFQNIGGADKLFNASGQLINEGTRTFLQAFMQAYAAWITANSNA